MSNHFFIWELNAADPREFTPGDPDADGGDADLRYFLGLAHELDRALGDQGMTVLITWHLDRFEDRFRDAVVLLINDEQYQLPAYAGHVQAVFKTGGTARNPLGDTLRLHPAIASRTVLREVRNVGRSWRRRIQTPQTRGAPVYELPLGFFRLTDVPMVPFADRDNDVFFAGSIESERGFTLRPRLVARRQMATALASVRTQLPGVLIDYSSGGPMANPAAMVDGDAYSHRLMQARIVLCPRGNFDETYRLMEAARSGCVAITERLPERWYYRDSPAIQLDRWASLPTLLRGLIADQDALAERGERMRAWWMTSLSEEAVTRYVTARLPCASVPTS
ncbi:MAG: hypothetical protein JWO02_1833 [Solirubrobacterales bacterium]|nr:hypothetical protein [Solirubrobacterales bacterium]